MKHGPSAADQKKRYAKQKTLGLCTRCRAKAVDGKSLCVKHADYMQKMNKSRSKEQKSRWSRNRIRNVKEAIFAHYGQVCACCGEKESKFLTIDHVNGDGHVDRKKGLSGHGLWRVVLNSGCPDSFRILCMNCNHAMGVWGMCPHGNLPPQRTNHPANSARRSVDEL